MQISRSEQKRRIKEVEQLVAELVRLPVQVLAQEKGLEEEVQQLVRETARLEGGARQRHIKYLTKQILPLPLDPLYALVAQHRGKSLVERKQMHELEVYRDALINEALEHRRYCQEMNAEWTENWSSDILAELKAWMPEIDVLTLARLSYLFVQTRNPRYSREIFRYLRSIQELRQRNRAQTP
jgi:ribosome-associated protein